MASDSTLLRFCFAFFSIPPFLFCDDKEEVSPDLWVANLLFWPFSWWFFFWFCFHFHFWFFVRCIARISSPRGARRQRWCYNSAYISFFIYFVASWLCLLFSPTPTYRVFGAFLSVFLLVLLLMKKVLFRGLINSHHPVLFDFFGLTHPLRG